MGAGRAGGAPGHCPAREPQAGTALRRRRAPGRAGGPVGGALRRIAGRHRRGAGVAVRQPRVPGPRGPHGEVQDALLLPGVGPARGWPARGQPAAADEGAGAPLPAEAAPLDASALLATLGPAISVRTRALVAQAEPNLRAALVLGRPGTEGGTLDLGRPAWGLHPAPAPLLPLWQSRRLAFVHAAGSPEATRSHFDAQDFMESGTPGRKSTADGWMNRLLGRCRRPPRPRRPRAVSIGPERQQRHRPWPRQCDVAAGRPGAGRLARAG